MFVGNASLFLWKMKTAGDVTITRSSALSADYDLDFLPLYTRGKAFQFSLSDVELMLKVCLCQLYVQTNYIS